MLGSSWENESRISLKSTTGLSARAPKKARPSSQLRLIQSGIFYLYGFDVIISKQHVETSALVVKFFVVIHQKTFADGILTEAETVYGSIVVTRIPFITGSFGLKASDVVHGAAQNG